MGQNEMKSAYIFIGRREYINFYFYFWENEITIIDFFLFK